MGSQQANMVSESNISSGAIDPSGPHDPAGDLGVDAVD